MPEPLGQTRNSAPFRRGHAWGASTGQEAALLGCPCPRSSCSHGLVWLGAGQFWLRGLESNQRRRSMNPLADLWPTPQNDDGPPLG